MLNLKKCSKCKEFKILSEFSPDRRKQDGHRYNCKKCANIENKKYYLRNIEKCKEKERLRRINDPEKERARKRKWRVENPEKAREKGRRDALKRYSTPKGKLINSMSTGIYESLKRGSKAGRKWEDLVGFTIDQLRKRLEKLFKPGMNWENYGTVWHIDHKIPIAVFNFEKPEHIDFRLCWSLKNLQPLEAKENIDKRAKIDKPFQPSLAIGVK